MRNIRVLSSALLLGASLIFTPLQAGRAAGRKCPAGGQRRQLPLEGAGGCASVAAFAAVTWSVLGTAPGIAPVSPQLASAPVSRQEVDATVLARSSAGVMLRDARLDELLAAHRQFGGATALQNPAGFLRNATFEGSSR